MKIRERLSKVQRERAGEDPAQFSKVRTNGVAIINRNCNLCHNVRGGPILRLFFLFNNQRQPFKPCYFRVIRVRRARTCMSKCESVL